MKKYDYLLVGGGLFSAVFAYRAVKNGKKCLVAEKRGQLGGNLYCDSIEGINVHRYGPHIFHTSDSRVWKFVNIVAEFNRYTNCPLACYKGEIYNMPFNMNTFNKMWGVRTPAEAKAIIDRQRAAVTGDPANLEEQAISLVGEDIYKKLIKGYTEKQWGRSCKELPSFIIKRLPVRYVYDNNYFNDRYQGIPVGGYNVMISRLFEGCDIMLDTDYNADRENLSGMAEKTLYTGTIDSLFDYCFGKLEYRSLKFETEVLDTENYQGVAVVNVVGVVAVVRKVENAGHGVVYKRYEIFAHSKHEERAFQAARILEYELQYIVGVSFLARQHVCQVSVGVEPEYQPSVRHGKLRVVKKLPTA